MKNHSFCRRMRSALAALMAAAISAAMPLGTVSANSGGVQESIESAEASTIQLMKTEGDVSVFNAGGRNLSLIENMKLYNGYRTDTQEASYAWISLDSEKLTKLDAVSEAEIRKSGKKLEILLNSGNLFFDVTKPLEEEETLNIRTSTMVMGIRGTSGWVKIIDKWRCQAYVLEGTVTCYVCDPVTGQIKHTVLTGGETAEFVVYEEEENGERCDILKRGFTKDEIDGFVLMELAGDPDLCQKIQDASGLDAAGAAALAAERLAADESRMAELLTGIREKYENQENNISKDPVWLGGERNDGTGTVQGDTPSDGTSGTGNTPAGGRTGTGNTPAGGTAGTGTAPVDDNGTAAADQSTDRPNNSGTTTDGQTPPDNSGTTTPTPETPVGKTVELTIGGTGDEAASAANIQKQLNDPEVTAVVVSNPNPSGSEDEAPAAITVDNGNSLTIPDGKTLTMQDGVGMNINEDATVTVDGTLNVDGDVINSGTLNING